MKKAIFLILLVPVIAFGQPVKSPSAFLGYPLGEHFTPHFAVINYFDYIAKERPNHVKLYHYGKTYEGRDLIYSVISDESNMKQLEKIRINNLRLTGLVSDQPGNTDMPAVVWLSFNVHGNEASSTEVAMQMLYELASGENLKAAEWLKNTVIIIDPSLNPDGRDRYVNWFNGMVGKNPNPMMFSREHIEPWPGGRPNHYYFDLNRDWAWQSQLETQNGMEAYHQWMPTVHVDFHEQYYDSPYYFPPAAEPMHEVITPFQRSFQSVVGKNNARYFDKMGWLYFTGEFFDLFYPAYGDTYPLYNGAIGMTYEQAGHSMGGISIAFDGDTLTLAQRIQHHLTAGLSTIETASAHQTDLNQAFQTFFQQTIKNGNGIYKTYILDGSNQGKLKALKTLLDRNKIQYGFAGKKSVVKGYRYFSGKTESYQTQSNDLIVSTLQPKGVLVRTLFEPESKLSDSLTYDITAWALPYVFGIDAYATPEVITFSEAVSTPVKNVPDDAYGYLASYNSIESGKFLAAMLKSGIKVRVSASPFSYQGNKYEAGTLIVLKSGNKEKIASLLNLAKQFEVALVPVNTGMMDAGVDFGSDKISQVNNLRVGMLANDRLNEHSVGAIWHFFDQQLNYPISLFSSSNPNKLPLKDLDVIILADGWYEGINSKEGNDELKDWLKNGGRLIAIGNAAIQMTSGEWGVTKKNGNTEELDKTNYNLVKRYGDRIRQSISNFVPGAIYKVNIDNTHPLGYGYPDVYYTLKTESVIFEFLSSGWNVGVIKKDALVAGFVGKNVMTNMHDGTVIASQSFGRGSITYFLEDPLFRSFWENGKLFLINAVFLNRN